MSAHMPADTANVGHLEILEVDMASQHPNLLAGPPYGTAVYEDVGAKRADYQSMGIPEYWRFDDTEDGSYHLGTVPLSLNLPAYGRDALAFADWIVCGYFGSVRMATADNDNKRRRYARSVTRGTQMRMTHMMRES